MQYDEKMKNIGRIYTTKTISYSRRITVLAIMMSIGFLSLWYRAGYLQIWQFDESLKAAEQTHLRRVRSLPPRGLITDRYGFALDPHLSVGLREPLHFVHRLPSNEVKGRLRLTGEVLADNRSSYQIIYPQKRTEIPSALCKKGESADLQRQRQALMQVLKNASPSLQVVASAKQGAWLNNAQTTVAGNPTASFFNIDEEILAVIAQRAPDFLLLAPPKRVYARIAPHVIGYIGKMDESIFQRLKTEDYTKNDIIGRTGLEEAYESYLRGRPGWRLVEVNVYEQVVKTYSQPSDYLSFPQRGALVVSTLDAALQRKAEELLADKVGAIIALDPRNGEVLAMASKPDFDPNLFIDSLDQNTWNRIITDPDHPLQNRAIAGQYPLGSAFKIVTGTAGLETGAISPQEFISCPGYFSLKGKRFRCWRERGHGKVNFYEAMRNSCNVYFYKLSLRRAMGPDILHHYATKLGLGQLTGIDISGEKRGFIPSSRDIPEKGRRWGAADTVNMSIGQGNVLVTPLQVANMMALIAVGKNYKPHLVKKIELVTGDIEVIQPEPLHTLNISAKTLNLLRQSLRAVVNNYGTGALARLPDVVVAGKTGTAETSSGEPHAWFTGYAPFTNPEIVVAIIVEHGVSGGKAAAPLAKEMFQTYFENKRNRGETLLARKDGSD